jgi:hypothetical protein
VKDFCGQLIGFTTLYFQISTVDICLSKIAVAKIIKITSNFSLFHFNRHKVEIKDESVDSLNLIHFRNMTHTTLAVVSLFLLAFIGGSAAAECNATSISTGSNDTCPCPDVFLDVPNLSVNQIYLAVDNLEAHVSLNAKVANLVQLTAGKLLICRHSSWTILIVQQEWMCPSTKSF